MSEPREAVTASRACRHRRRHTGTGIADLDDHDIPGRQALLLAMAAQGLDELLFGTRYHGYHFRRLSGRWHLP